MPGTPLTRAVILSVALTPGLSSGAWAQAASCRKTSYTGQTQNQSTPAQQTSLAGADTGLDPALGTQALQEQAAAQAAANGAQQDQQTYTQALQQAQQDTQAAVQKAQQQAQQQASLQQPNGLNQAGTGGGGQTGGNMVTPAPPGSTFSDSFASLDTNKWGFNYPWSDACDNSGNSDATQYAAYASPACSGQPNPFSTGANGLGIAINSGTVAGKPAYTGQLYSKQAFQYGYFEETAKLPTTTGTGAAFWLMPQGGGWPPELDIMESLGQDGSTVYGTVHDTGGAPQQQVASNVSGGSGSGFHTYGVDWQPDTITYYVDGKATGSVATPASMHQPMYMILSMNSSPPGNTNWGSPINTSQPVNDNYQIKSVNVYATNPYAGK